MVRCSFIIYWFWHLHWIFRYSSVTEANATNYVVEGFASAFYIALVPSIIFIGRQKAYKNDYEWWKLSMLCAVLRSSITLLGFYVNKAAVYGYGTCLMILAMIALRIIIKADQANQPHTI